METYNSDEQLQVLRQWLRDNGASLLAGLLLGGIIIAGWTGWKYYTTRQAQLASVQFEQVRVALQGNNSKVAEQATERLTTDYARTPYAALAALTLAADQVKRKQFEAALAHYQWVQQEARDRNLRKIASLRLARLLWSLGRSEEALAALNTGKPGSFTPLFMELRGDILAGQGRDNEARQAYTEAMTPDLSSELRAGIELKLNDLNSQAPSSATTAPAASKGG